MWKRWRMVKEVAQVRLHVIQPTTAVGFGTVLQFTDVEIHVLMQALILIEIREHVATNDNFEASDTLSLDASIFYV
jgi:hypothetical protein